MAKKMTPEQKEAKRIANIEYRKRRTEREQKAQAEAAALRANRDIDPTREEWLERASKMLLKHLETLGYVPTGRVRVSMAPLGKRKSGKVLGVCYSDECSEGAYREIFIAPELVDTRKLLGVLTHELLHACLPHKTGHRAPFKRACTAVGFEFEKCESAVDGAGFWGWAGKLADDLGSIPHKRLNTDRASGEGKKQSTRLIKCECPDCGTIWRMARKPMASIAALQAFDPYMNCVSPECSGKIMLSELIEGLDEGDEEE